MRITEEFYKNPATALAPMLLGKLLCRRIDGRVIRSRITETECYYGREDTACHAHKGKTERTKTLFEGGGIAYVYLCYGVHNLLNVVSGEKGFPEGILLRGIESASGPGRLTKFMQVDRSFNGEHLPTSNRLWLEDDGFLPAYSLSKRVGIDYATEEYREKLWRFIADSPSR